MTTTPIIPAVLKGKKHFEILDGLRGVAAVAVVFFHFLEFSVPDYVDNWIAHSYLAVDFFFCLSGFVIAYAYDSRVKEIGTLNFFKLRLIRLQPLVFIGAFIGLLTFVFDPFSSLYGQYGIKETLLMFLSSAFMIPYPLITERYFNLFHFNPPTWSLFWEYIANIFYAIILFKLHKKALWLFTIVAAILLVYVGHHYENLAVGFGGDNFFGGGARIFYSFLVGILAFRSKWIIKSNLNFTSLSILLAVAFFIPFIKDLNWIIDTVIVLFYFPFLLALGAGIDVSKKAKGICKFSGEISYPLYMIHYLFLWLFLSYVEANKPTLMTMHSIMVIGVLLLIAFAHLILKFVDIPVRNFLKNKMR
ncbi:acyltransferase family protein [Flavobacterium gilvum]|uniref:Acyltransferase n=1 Tax=Flavobacterium gilvum TaxID=1492737 RepID=A0AAC9I417_9FLAO|nr:acyltransferase [Flavobacterium gilvum]AOW09006.1 acyltransferase [Flavobacterium gilvum]KFC60549.1 hypothetical protein FEM08_05910 [Flavobacterium gilvum]